MNITMSKRPHNYVPKYELDTMFRPLFKPSKYKNKMKINRLCDDSIYETYTHLYHMIKDETKPTEMIFCPSCHCGVQFRNVYKHVHSLQHRYA